MAGDLSIGSDLAGYRILSLIARGGMGAVYLAEDSRLGRKVALKLPAPELAQDPSFRERFLRESRLAASLDHQHIVPVYEAGESDGQLYIAMRYVEGEDLGALLEREGPLPSDRAVSILDKVASALDAAHHKGLVHRDVKPGNVLLSAPDQVYLSDFGLTKRTGSGSVLTRTGQVVGTLDYLAPEQIEGKEVDARADQYSLACLAFHCLTGEVPFSKDTEAALLYAHLRDPPPKATARRPDLPAEVDRVIARGIAKRPEDRYGSCGELARALRTAVGPVPVPRPPTLPGRRVRLAVLAGAAVLAVVGLVLALVLAPGQEAEKPAPVSGETSPAETEDPSPTGSPTARPLSAVEEDLLLRIPSEIGETCVPATTFPPEAAGAVTCTSGDVTVTYSAFDSRGQMDAWFDLETAPVEAMPGSCESQSLAFGPYSIGLEPAGRVLCYREEPAPANSNRGMSWIQWTDERLLVYAVASRPDFGDGDLHRWWVDVAGPVEVPGEQKDIAGDLELFPAGTYTTRVTDQDRIALGETFPRYFVGRWTLEFGEGDLAITAPDESVLPPAFGRYVSSKGNRVVLYMQAYPGAPAGSCYEQPDVYRWRLEGDQLRFTELRRCWFAFETTTLEIKLWTRSA